MEGCAEGSIMVGCQQKVGTKVQIFIQTFVPTNEYHLLYGKMLFIIGKRHLLPGPFRHKRVHQHHEEAEQGYKKGIIDAP